MNPPDAPPSTSITLSGTDQPAPSSPETSGARRPPVRALRSAPERLEVALILGLVLLLNFLPGWFLQHASLRWGLLATQILFIAAPVFLAIRWFYLDRRAVLPFSWPGGRALGGAILGAFGLNHLLNYAVIWQDRIFPLPESLKDLFNTLVSFDGPLDFLCLLLLVGVVPGVCEEILFRGFVHAGLHRALESGSMAVVVGAFVFAGFHLNPWRFVVLLIIGLYLGFLVQRTGSLVPSIVAHTLINIQSVALATLGEQAQETVVHSSWSHALACACLVAAALLLGRPAA
jgi:membrane protease YdiL (CAAX protease family)